MEKQGSLELFGEVAMCSVLAEIIEFIKRSKTDQAERRAAAFGMVLAAQNAVGDSKYFEDSRHVLDEMGRAKAALDSACWHVVPVVTTTGSILLSTQLFLEEMTVPCTEWPLPGEVAEAAWAAAVDLLANKGADSA